METQSPCRTHPPPSSFAAAHLASQGSPTSAAAKVGSQSQQKKAELFSRFDVKETSFHVYTGRIDLHLCDDASPGNLTLPYLWVNRLLFSLIWRTVQALIYERVGQMPVESRKSKGVMQSWNRSMVSLDLPEWQDVLLSTLGVSE